MQYKQVPVLQNIEIAPGVFSMTVPEDRPPRAGQFYMLRRPGAAVVLPRAISVCDWSEGVLRFLYQVVGRGTGEFSRLHPGEDICITGPLGNGFPVPERYGKVALVGGGIGAAPLLYTAKLLHERDFSCDVLLGYRDETFLRAEFTPYAEHVMVATESGVAGNKGFVTSLLEPESYAAVLTCGPAPMMKAVTVQCESSGTPVWVSLENRMACGLGACLVCTCTDKAGKNHRICKDGPVFRGEGIDFDA